MSTEIAATTRIHGQKPIAKQRARPSNQTKPCMPPYAFLGFNDPNEPMREAKARATKNIERLKPPKAKARARPISTMAPEMPLVTERTGFRMMYLFL
jgi:hypothetical protein